MTQWAQELADAAFEFLKVRVERGSRARLVHRW
jgi:hypothetical protein